MKHNKKNILFICILLFLLVAGVFLAYFLLWKAPDIEKIEIDTDYLIDLRARGLGDESDLETLKQKEEIAKTDANPEYQWAGTFDTLPSDSLDDYDELLCRFYLKNTTLLTQTVSLVQVSAFDRDAGIFVMSECLWPEQIRSGETECITSSLLIYTAGKTEEEIREFIRTLEFQITYSSRLRSDGNLFCTAEDAVIQKFVPDEPVVSEE